MKLRFLVAKFPVAHRSAGRLHLLLCLMLSAPALAGGLSTPTNWPSLAATSSPQGEEDGAGTTVIVLQPDLQTEAQTDTPQTEAATTDAPTQRTTGNYTGRCRETGKCVCVCVCILVERDKTLAKYPEVSAAAPVNIFRRPGGSEATL